MPMFISRLIVLGASLVCSVESTRWPVSAALTAISAVSKSRISPTRMMFGSCRRKARSAAAKFRPMFSLDLHLVDAGQVELDRVLGGHDVRLGRVDAARSTSTACWSCRCRSGRSPAPCPTASGSPPRTCASDSGSKPSLRHVEHQLVAVEQAQDDLLAEQRRQAPRRGSRSPWLAVVVVADLDAAVLRQALLGDVELRHDLDARGDRVAELQRRRHDVVEHAVDAVPDPAAPSRTARCGCRSRPSGWPTSACTLTSRMTGASSPCLRQRLDADLLELLEHLDVGVDRRRGMSSSALVATSRALGGSAAPLRAAA